ncbi:MAG: efflux transporter outer membrane subunit [Gammaproteobacteria bacterium]|nr:efflux transporter outer membrane subunit [Gammaproteobacteria bacterium]
MKCLSLTLLVVLVGACAIGPDYEKPLVETPETWRFTDAEASEVVNTRWWTQFEDPVLDKLIDEALTANLDVRIAAARVEQFAARLNITRSDFYPQVGYGVSGDRQGISDNKAGDLGIDSISGNYQATINVGWELDVWGRIRRASESSRAQLLAAEESRRTVILSLVSSVATSYVGLRSLDRQLGIAIETRDAREETLRLFELQYDGGVIGQLQLSQIQSEYELAVSAIPSIESDIAILENLIAVLIGRNPGSVPRGKTIDELTLARIPNGVPSDLLLRRPDIRAAEQDLISNNAQIGVARAAYFPRISLTGLVGLASGDIGSWFESDAATWAVGGTLSGSIFTGGRISGGVKQAEALQQQSLFTYQQTILTALKEVEDALISTQKARERLVSDGRRVEALMEYERIARLRYDNGYTSYIEVLDSQRSLFNAELNYVNTQNDVYVGLINTYKALGGGWVVLAEQRANEIDFPEDEDAYTPDPASAASYDGTTSPKQ